MHMTEAKPLQPLPFGNVLIVGTKPSNLDEELRTHPRVILWDSQHESWTSKDVPHNVRAIFVTRFIGHSAFAKILAEARKKQITIFNPQGTGIIARQVKELLATPSSVQPTIVEELTTTVEQPTIPQETIVESKNKPGKLTPLHKLIDFKRTNKENAEVLLIEAKLRGITTTRASILQLLVVQRRKVGAFTRKKAVVPTTSKKVQDVDVSVQILDEMIKGLTDMRQFIVSTVEENNFLRVKLAKFKKMIEE
jgi:hypothetical protein